MPRRPPFSTLGKVLIALAVILILARGWAQAREKEKVLYRFKSGSDAAAPFGDLHFDNAGNLYGTTNGGGVHGAGTVFELSPEGGGLWKARVLYSFTAGSDGGGPWAGVILDASGNLYGTTVQDDYNNGTVFELSPQAGGSWVETTLYDFEGLAGAEPDGDLALDPQGNLYGTTWDGGMNGFGNVFELTPLSDGGWSETEVYSFNGRAGAYSSSGVILDASGNLYGTTACPATIYELSPGSNWAETVLGKYNAPSMPD